MIYLIGGAPRCGKSILAKQLSSRLRISRISTDSVRAMLLASVPKSQRKKLFPKTAMRASKGQFRFEAFNPKEILRVTKTESDTMWPSVRAFVESLIAREQDYIIEGVHLQPRHIAKLKKTKHWTQIRAVFLVKTDIEKITSGFPRFKGSHDWMYPNIKDEPEKIAKAAEMVKAHGEYTATQARKYKLNLVHMDDGFPKKIADTMKRLIA